MAIKITYSVWCQIRKTVLDTGQPVWGEQENFAEFCPVEFDTLAEAETYCDDLMIGE